MNEGRYREKTIARTAAAAIGVMLVVAVMLMWSWNTIAVDLFKAPTAGFRHALALEIAIFAVGGLAASCARLGKHGHDRAAVSQ